MSDLRLPYYTLSSEAFSGFKTIKNTLENSSLSIELIELLYMRVSQINGCSFCLEMHGKSLRKHGESDAKIDSLSGWQVSSLYSTQERLALEWAESLTHISASSTSDAIYNKLKSEFSDQQISDMTMAISLMNGLNRIAISMLQ